MRKCRYVLLFCAFVLSLAFASGCRTGGGAVSNPDVVRFGIVTDVHYADTDARGTRHYRDSLEKMRSAVRRMNTEELDFVVELGDFIDRPVPPDEIATLHHLGAIEREFQQFRGATYHVLGNHDLEDLSKEEFLRGVSNTGVAPDRSYYSFMAGGVQFIVLDADFRSDGAPYERGHFDWADSNIPRSQALWLIDALLERDGPAVILVHQRLDGEGRECVRSARELRALFKESGRIVAVLQGHDHGGGMQVIDGIPYYTLKAMVEGPGPENGAWALVEIRRDRSVRITGFDRAASWP